MNFDLLSMFKNGCFCIRDSITVKSEKYYIKDVIGEGGFSKVYLVESSYNKRHYAIKRVICHSLDDEAIALNEVKCHEKVQHENIIHLVNYELIGSADPVSNSTSILYLVLPFYRKGTLNHELERRSMLKKPFESEHILKIFHKICLGVKAFHDLQPPLAHRDLKTANILLDIDDTPIIMDLGSAAAARVKISSMLDAQNLQDLAAERCSMPYKAPELFNVENHSMIDERTDIWSLGCLLYAMCYYKSPFDIIYEKGDSVALAVLSGKISFPECHTYEKVMNDLILFLLNINPSERPFIDIVIKKVESVQEMYSVGA